MSPRNCFFLRLRKRLFSLAFYFAVVAASLATPTATSARPPCQIINGCQIYFFYPCSLSGTVCNPCYADACIYKCGSNYYIYPGSCCTCA
jgi:hypothetical protein